MKLGVGFGYYIDLEEEKGLGSLLKASVGLRVYLGDFMLLSFWMRALNLLL